MNLWMIHMVLLGISLRDVRTTSLTNHLNRLREVLRSRERIVERDPRLAGVTYSGDLQVNILNFLVSLRFQEL